MENLSIVEDVPGANTAELEQVSNTLSGGYSSFLEDT